MRDDEYFKELYRLLLQLIAKVDRLPDSLRQPELPPGRWYDTRVAAEIIGCNRVSLQRWCSKRMKAKLPGVRYDSRHAGICFDCCHQAGPPPKAPPSKIGAHRMPTRPRAAI